MTRLQRDARREARKALADGPILYNPHRLDGKNGPLVEHTEESLWPYFLLRKYHNAGSLESST